MDGRNDSLRKGGFARQCSGRQRSLGGWPMTGMHHRNGAGIGFLMRRMDFMRLFLCPQPIGPQPIGPQPICSSSAHRTALGGEGLQ